MSDRILHFRESLDPATLATIDALRALIATADPGLVEGFKWNAPSFTIDGNDRITLGIERKGGVRVVLHRGAKVKDNSEFAFADPDQLARWAAPDRGVIIVADAGEVAVRAAALTDLFARWIAATR